MWTLIVAGGWLPIPGVVQKCHFRVTPEIDRALMVREFLLLGVP
jgi:hypothetical protein